MIEESFVRLHSHDFVQMAVKSELGQDVDVPLKRRLTDARSHAALMDARKGVGHLSALVVRLREEAVRFDGRTMLQGSDPRLAAQRRLGFLSAVADALVEPAAGTSEIANVRGGARRAGPPGRVSIELEKKPTYAG